MTKGEYREKVMELCSHKPREYALDWMHKVRTFEKKIIFGGGGLAKCWIKIWQRYHMVPDYICDNNKDYWGRRIEGVMCISPSDILNINEDVVIFVAVRNYQVIYEQLLKMGVKNENIIVGTSSTWSLEANYLITQRGISVNDLCKAVCSVIDICEDEISAKICYQTLSNWLFDCNLSIDYTGESYFIPEIYKGAQEVFVDVGAFDGDTLESFLAKYKDSFDKYYAFELDETNYQKLCSRINGLSDAVKDKIVTYNLGLWNEEKEIFYESNNTSTMINLNGECKGRVDSLDHILGDEKVTFIKMDIEGAEMAALKGCEIHIRKYNPVLAISIYHSVYDFIKIPLMLKEFGYRIIIRHHDYNAHEIVCYALK